MEQSNYDAWVRLSNTSYEYVYTADPSAFPCVQSIGSSLQRAGRRSKVSMWLCWLIISDKSVHTF